MKRMCSRLRHRITLQQEVETPDGAGGYAKSWADVADLWAEIMPVISSGAKLDKSAGREIVLGGQIQHELSHRILLRYRDDITPSMRLVYENSIFNIVYVANVEERNETLQLLVHQGAAI